MPVRRHPVLARQARPVRDDDGDRVDPEVLQHPVGRAAAEAGADGAGARKLERGHGPKNPLGVDVVGLGVRPAHVSRERRRDERGRPVHPLVGRPFPRPRHDQRVADQPDPPVPERVPEGPDEVGVGLVDHVVGHDERPEHVADAQRADAVGPLLEHAGQVAPALAPGPRRVPGAADDEGAGQRPVLDGPVEVQRRPVAEVGAERVERGRRRDQLHVAGRDHRVVRVPGVEHPAGVEVADQDAPRRPVEVAVVEDLVDLVRQRGPRVGRLGGGGEGEGEQGREGGEATEQNGAGEGGRRERNDGPAPAVPPDGSKSSPRPGPPAGWRRRWGSGHGPSGSGWRSTPGGSASNASGGPSTSRTWTQHPQPRSSETDRRTGPQRSSHASTASASAGS